MKRRRYIGQANKVGIEFTDLSTSNLNAQQAGMVYGKTLSGGTSIDATWISDNSYSNIYLYSVSTKEKIVADLNNNASVFVVIELDSLQYIIGLNNNSIEIKNCLDLTDYSTNLAYQWNFFGSNSNFDLRNSGNASIYLDVSEDGQLKTKTNNTVRSFSRAGSVLKKYGSTDISWNLYRNYSNVEIKQNDANLTAFLYSYTSDWNFSLVTFTLTYTYTLTKKEVGTFNNSQNLMLIVKDTSGSYYVVGNSSGSFTFQQVSPTFTNNGNTVTFQLSAELSSRYSFYALPNGNQITLQSRYDTTKYLTIPSEDNTVLTLSGTQSLFNYSNTNGLSVNRSVSSVFPIGVMSIFQSFLVEQYRLSENGNTSGGTTIVFRKDGSTWSPYYGSLNAGETYAIAVREAPDDPDNPGAVTADYYLVGYDGTKMTHHNFSTFADIVITSDCEFVATQGTYGVGLTSSSRGLNVNNEYLAMLDVSADWVYIGDSVTPENSRLWSVTTQTVTYYPEYANSDLEANTSATDTKAECYLVQNGKIQTLVDELVSGETYVIVFVDDGNHYAACVSGTDIVPVLFVDKLPSKLPAAYQFTAEASGQGFLLKQNNQAMGVATNAKLTLGYNAVWTYTGGTTE